MSACLHNKRDSVTPVTCHACHAVTLQSRKRAYLGAAQRDTVTFSRLMSRCHASAHMEWLGSFSGGAAGGALSPGLKPSPIFQLSIRFPFSVTGRLP